MILPATNQKCSPNSGSTDNASALRRDAASPDLQVGYFDPDETRAELRGNLPHWRQDGVTYFVTFRLADSIPKSKLELWERERTEWLRLHPEPHDE